MSPTPRIRAYQPADEKPVRFMVGQSQMELLAFANNNMYFHPLTLAIWIAVSSVFAQVMHWWPEAGHSVFGYLRVLPAFFAPAVPIMFWIDWKNRADVEARTEQVLRRPDLHDLGAYYARSPASGFYVLEFGAQRLIGLAAVDASPNAGSDAIITKDLSAQDLRPLLSSKGTARVATLRHFFVEEAFRATGVDGDLLRFAVRRTFEGDKTVRAVRVQESTLRPHVLRCLREVGFVKSENAGTIGIASWEISWWTLDRKTWETAASKET